MLLGRMLGEKLGENRAHIRRHRGGTNGLGLHGRAHGEIKAGTSHGEEDNNGVDKAERAGTPFEIKATSVEHHISQVSPITTSRGGLRSDVG